MKDIEEIDPLMYPLPPHQLAMLQIVGDMVMEHGTWPVYQYVQARLDDIGLRAEEVFASLPVMSHASLNYGLIRLDNNGRDEEPVKLSIAGMAHLEAFASTVDMFLRVVNGLADRRAAASFDPLRVVTVEVFGLEIVEAVGIADESLLGLLPQFLKGEPATWHGDWPGDEHGVYRPSSFIRRFRAVGGINDYLARIRAWLLPAKPASPPQYVSPLALVASFDYLDVVWQLRFGKKLVHVPSAERAVRLALEASTAEEFDNRLSALGEMFKGFDVPGTNGGTFDRMRTFLRAALPAHSIPPVLGAIDVLQNVTHVRNAGQHIDASRQAAKALPALGITYPISDYEAAWVTVQLHVVNALETIRNEVSASATHVPAQPAPEARRRSAHRRPNSRAAR